METSGHKALMQRVFEELSQGNSSPFMDALGDDVRWTIIGTTRWSRTFVGKDAVLSELLQPLRALMAERIKVTARRILADGDCVVVEATGRAVTRAGVPYNNTYCWIFRFESGKVREMTEYLDTALVEAALTPAHG